MIIHFSCSLVCRRGDVASYPGPSHSEWEGPGYEARGDIMLFLLQKYEFITVC